MTSTPKPLSVMDLKKAIDLTIEHSNNYTDFNEVPVLVTMAEPSLGSRAAAAVICAGMGFDWESGQFRLDTNKELVNKGNTLSDVKPVVCRPYDGRNLYWCPRCGNRVSKDDHFCRSCGQQMR